MMERVKKLRADERRLMPVLIPSAFPCKLKTCRPALTCHSSKQKAQNAYQQQILDMHNVKVRKIPSEDVSIANVKEHIHYRYKCYRKCLPRLCHKKTQLTGLEQTKREILSRVYS